MLFEISKGVLVVFVLYILISIVWQQAELYFYGVITPRKLDDFIAVILATSLFLNFNFK